MGGEYKMVTIKVLEQDKKKGTMTFELGNTSPAFANALRRAMIEDVPTMAIEVVEFSNNSSVLYDEMLAHRLGLLPLTTDLKSYVLPKDCKCEGEGCARCTLELSMKTKAVGIVTADLIESKDPKVVPVYGETPIAKLVKGQEIEFLAKAVLGTGREHVKWSPGNTWYIYKPKVTVNASSKKLEEFKDQYPPQIFDAKGKINKKALDTPAILDACDGVCDDIIKIDYDAGSFVFYVESWGQLTPKDMVLKAFEVIDEQLDEVTDLIKSVK